MSHSIHQTPGRIRICTPALKNDATAASRVETMLYALDGILAVRVNPVIGSVTVTYQEAITFAAPIIDLFTKHGFLQGIVGFPRPMPRMKNVRAMRPATPQALSPAANQVISFVGRMVLRSLVRKTIGRTALLVVDAFL